MKINMIPNPNKYIPPPISQLLKIFKMNKHTNPQNKNKL